MSLEDLTIFTVRECASLLHMSESRVRQLISRGELKGYVHRGRMNTKRLMVLESDLKTYIYSTYLEQYWKGNKRPESMPEITTNKYEPVRIYNKRGKDT